MKEFGVESFQIKENQYYCEDVAIKKIVEQVGTPAFIYSQNYFVNRFEELDKALSFIPHMICYSVKTNSNIAVCRALAEAGSGFDIVSGGELQRVLRAGVDPKKVVFAGVGKTEEEIELALNCDILFFTVESEPELRMISKVAQRIGKKGPVALRVNPDVDPQTHKYITTGKAESKFGLDIVRAKNLFKEAMELPSIDVVGIQMHIGSQITKTQPYVDAIRKMTFWIEEIQKEGIDIKYFDIGGGLGIVYDDEKPATAVEFAEAIRPLVENLGLTLLMEPGRFIAGNAGVLVSKVVYLKENPTKKFVIVDAAMNDLIRPSLYEAYHEVCSVEQNHNGNEVVADIVGPICETGDFFAKDRKIPDVQEGELILVKSAGAYGFTMASNYNTRPRAVEVMVKGDQFSVIKERETVDQLLAGEKLPDWLK